MKFKNIFDNPDKARRRPSGGVGDFRTGRDYSFTPDMELAISAAMATQRPLLVTGPAGCGKPSLARGTAARLGWRCLERTVNSRTEITSLQWDIDLLQRLEDAQGPGMNPQMLAYVRPSVLWKALDAASAADPLLLLQGDAGKNAPLEPAVVLIDEIDKADPDLPNNLLEVLGGLRFEVADTGLRVTCRSGVPLIVITSNDERDLPPAFVRRCICLAMGQPDLAAVARLHFPKDGKTIDAALKLLAPPPTSASRSAAGLAPSAAEFLDFVQACKLLQVRPGSDGWLRLAEACVLKGRSGATPAGRGV